MLRGSVRGTPAGMTGLTTRPVARRGWWLAFARSAWVVLALVVLGLFVRGAPILWQHLQVVCSPGACPAYGMYAPFAAQLAAVGLSPQVLATYLTLLDGFGVVVYLAVAGVLIWRRPDQPVAVLAAFALLLFGGASTCDSVGVLVPTAPAPLARLALCLRAFGAVAVALLFCVLPDGRFVPRWTAGVAAATTLVALAIAAFPGTHFDLQTWGPAAPLPFVGALLAGQVAHYRRLADPMQRQQTKWVMFGLAVAVLDFYALPALLDPLHVGMGEDPLPAVLEQIGTITVYSLALLALPVSIAVAILRHRLFDIDRLITGTLVYGVLWLGITLAYLGLTAALGQAAGERLPVPVAVLFTLSVALLAQPARARLERLADRWVFGARLGRYELLARFGTSLEQAVGPEELAQRVVATVRQGLGVRWARVWLGGTPSRLQPVAADGIDPHAPAPPALVSPLVHGQEVIGRLECGPKQRGDAFDLRDAELLAAVGRQAALALRNARLADELAARLRELAASRTRLVQAEEAGRRRLERDIHDGVQQQLVALIAKARLARNQLGRDPARAGTTLAELQDDARQALQDLRELSQGIHPAVLGDRGLVEALEARLARLPLAVQLECDRLTRATRFAEAVEGAAYFLVSEALTNTLKHAAASHACVRLARVEGRLRVEVVDDGRGFDPEHVDRRGLCGLADRIEALGGTLQISSHPGEGTRLVATLPEAEVAHV